MSQTLLRLETVGLIAIGGFTGAGVRYGISTVVTGTPGTLTANVIGCFLLGFLWYEGRYTDFISDQSRIVFGTGFLSSLTTYSTFAYETTVLSPAYALANISANYAIGFSAVLIGRAVATRLREATNG